MYDYAIVDEFGNMSNIAGKNKVILFLPPSLDMSLLCLLVDRVGWQSASEEKKSQKKWDEGGVVENVGRDGLYILVSTTTKSGS